MKSSLRYPMPKGIPCPGIGIQVRMLYIRGYSMPRGGGQWLGGSPRKPESRGTPCPAGHLPAPECHRTARVLRGRRGLGGLRARRGRVSPQPAAACASLAGPLFAQGSQLPLAHAAAYKAEPGPAAGQRRRQRQAAAGPPSPPPAACLSRPAGTMRAALLLLLALLLPGRAARPKLALPIRPDTDPLPPGGAAGRSPPASFPRTPPLRVPPSYTSGCRAPTSCIALRAPPPPCHSHPCLCTASLHPSFSCTSHPAPGLPAGQDRDRERDRELDRERERPPCPAGDGAVPAAVRGCGRGVPAARR